MDLYRKEGRRKEQIGVACVRRRRAAGLATGGSAPLRRFPLGLPAVIRWGPVMPPKQDTQRNGMRASERGVHASCHGPNRPIVRQAVRETWPVQRAACLVPTMPPGSEVNLCPIPSAITRDRCNNFGSFWLATKIYLAKI